MRNPTIQEFEEIINEQVKLITMAPEVENFFDVIDFLKEKNVVISLGHSSAGFEYFKRAFQSGVNRITHFSNALTPLPHRNIGGTGSALYLDFYLEMICDGIHLSPEFVDLTYKIKGPDK
ncbi:MAG: N-acetylglucosamine-6-phosphate deacetylase, partial [Defluviitoga tunisiensis]